MQTTSINFTDTLIRRGIYPYVKEKPPITPGYDDRMNPLDLFIKAGVGVKVEFLKESYEKSGYKFSGLTFTGSKYISIDPVRSNNSKIGILDQLLFDIGLRFTFVKAKKGWFK